MSSSHCKAIGPKVALPTSSWVQVQPAAVEVDGGFEVFDIAVAAGEASEGHDGAVDAFGHAVDHPVLAVGEDAVEVIA